MMESVYNSCKAYMLYRYFIDQYGFLVVCTTFFFVLCVSPVTGDECNEQEVNNNLVEVSVDKHNLNGSGVLLTFDGYIVTAAHVLIEGIYPPIPLRYFVRFHDKPDGTNSVWQGASLRKLDKHLDLAILKLDALPQRPSLTIAAPTSSGSGMKSACLAGFGLRKDPSGKVTRLGFKSFDSKLLPDESGYMIPQDKVSSGYSGGGVFNNGQFIGMIVGRRVVGGSYVVPAGNIVDFAGSLGIYINDHDRFEPGSPPQVLRREIQGIQNSINENRRQLARVFRSMNWDIELLPPKDDDFNIVLKPTLAFPDQILDGYFQGDLTVHFDQDDFRQRLQDNKEIHKAVISAEIKANEAIIENIKDEITEIKGRYFSEGLELKNAPVSKFIIKGQIHYQGWTRDIIYKELNVDQY